MNFISKIGFVLLFSLSALTFLRGQELKIFKTFDDLEKYIIKENDTTYVINFWATWCKPCVKELPYFEQLSSSSNGQKIKVILVSLDFSKQVDSHLKPFISKNKYSADIVLMADKKYNNWLHKVDDSWSGSIPATLLVKGSKRHFEEKEFDSYQELSNCVKSFQSL